MTSAIVRTNPTSGTATTSSVRDNFGSAADEINVLQRSSTELKLTTGGGAAPYSVNFGSSPTFSFVDGARISVRINATNDASANIIVAPGISPIPIVKTDNSFLLAGDLVADSIYDLIYNANSSLGYPVWIGLNIDTVTSQDALLTTILGGLYPVGGLLTTTNSANPGDADYFFSGITFGTWEAYAQGRVSVGVDTGFGTGFVSGERNESNVTIIIAEKTVSVGDQITVSGFTNDTTANGSWTVTSVVTAAGQTTIVYSSPSIAIVSSLVGTDVKVINESFNAAGEIGGESTHTLTQEEMAGHNHHLFSTVVNSSTFPAKDNYANRGKGDDGSTNYEIRADGTYATLALSSNVVEESTGNTVTTDQPHNNLQPYITTYIWKRVVTP